MFSAKKTLSKYGEEFKLSPKKLAIKKKISLMVLNDLKISCEKRKIPFYACFGTLLGAVRHKGFIPWDDDVDVCACIDDFDKIIKAINDDYPGKYFFAGCGKGDFEDPFYGLKMMLLNTSEVEPSLQAYEYKRGIGVDIFPLIETYKNRLMRYFHKLKIKFLIHAGTIGYEFRHPFKINSFKDFRAKLYFIFRKFLGIFLSPFYRSIRKNLISTFYKKRNADCFLIDGLMNSKAKYYFSNIDLKNVKMYQFENMFIPSFENYDFALNVFYGKNYMDIPPLDKQERHSYLYIDFGNYS